MPKQQQAESDADVDVGDGDKDCKDCSETQEAKVWKSDNEKWLEGTKTWKRADKVLKRAESMPRDFWGAEPKEEDSAFPVTLSMKLENRAFRADYIETLRVRDSQRKLYASWGDMIVLIVVNIVIGCHGEVRFLFVLPSFVFLLFIYLCVPSPSLIPFFPSAV